MIADPDLERPEELPEDPSRRQWLLRLGEFVALAGVSGIVPEFATHFAQGQQTAAAALPPGLYNGSQDHLVHALSSGGSKWTPPAGSETEYVQPSSGAYHPQFFSAEDFPVVTRLIAILLGSVDTTAVSQAARWCDLWLLSAGEVRSAAQQLDPLHRSLAVAYYGEDAVREAETADPQAIAQVGVRALRDLSTKLYGRDFLALTDAEQTNFVSNVSKAADGTAVHKFFQLTRREAVRGYYTSAEGLKELDYKGNAFYGESPGCQSKTE
jgi:gluconate 2-dehydrogenase subunit 3-like protein